jgi:prepilin signal peptidase PulO-like enzyme (type II secretory pathway)
MIVLCMTAGLLGGSLINWAGDYLLHFARIETAVAPQPGSRPVLAVWHLLSSLISHSGPARPKSLCLNAAVELGAGLLFIFLWERMGLSWKWLYLAVACLFFLLIAIMDLKYRLVLNVLVYPAAAIALLVHCIPPGRDTLIALLGGAFGLAPFLAAALLKPEGIGAGDVKLAALIGLIVGFPQVMIALIVAVLAGGIVAMSLFLVRGWKLGNYIPYAPFLCLGAVFSLLYSTSPLIGVR